MTQPLDGQPLIRGLEKPISRLALGTAFYGRDGESDWHARTGTPLFSWSSQASAWSSHS